jgi:hypothetical protein
VAVAYVHTYCSKVVPALLVHQMIVNRARLAMHEIDVPLLRDRVCALAPLKLEDANDIKQMSKL